MPLAPSQFLLSHFDRLAEAPGGLAKLRALIVQLAMQGKLVAQSKADEPASVLLERIRAEKKRLISKGSISKEKPLSEIEAEEAPFEIPATWAWSRLGDALEYSAGENTSPDELPSNGWLLELEDIEKDTSRLLNEAVVSDRNPTSHKTKFRMGDVLYGKLRPYLNKAIVAHRVGFCTTEIIAIRPLCDVDPQFIKWALKRSDFLTYVARVGYGTKMPRLGTDDGRNALIPLPPLAEQRRIVAKVEELMGLCDALEAAQQKRETVRTRLRTSALHQLASPDSDSKSAAFALNHIDQITTDSEDIASVRASIRLLAATGRITASGTTVFQSAGESEEGFSVPSNWQIRNFGSILREAHTGLERSKAEQSPNRKYAYLKMNNMTNDGRCDLSSVVRVDASKEEVADYALSSGDFLFNTRNSVELVGKTCVYQETDSEPVLLNNNILKVRFVDGCDSHFINLWFCCPAGRAGLARLKSSTTNVAAIYQGKLNTFLVPLPPLAEQRRIVAKVDELMAVLAALEATLTTARTTSVKLLSAITSFSTP